MARRRGATRREAAVWAGALRKAALDTVASGPDKGQRKIDLIARQVVRLAMAGDLNAIQEIGNRLDGRPVAAAPLPDADAPLRVVYSWGETLEALPTSDPAKRGD
jgi:hypothetical protein